MKVGIPKEIYPHERASRPRPTRSRRWSKLGLEVVVEAGAGDASTFADAAYVEAGARIVPTPRRVYAEARHRPQGAAADRARPGGAHEADLLEAGRDADQLHLAGAEQAAASTGWRRAR